jgi:hypothetical protein
MQRSTTLAFLALFAACGTLEVADGGGGGNPADGPTVASITPERGPVAGGNEVTLSGTGFVEGSAVIIGGIEAEAPIVENETTIRVTVPAGANVETALDVFVFGPDGFAELPDSYTYNQLPTITGLSAAFGPLAGGATLDVSGEFLQTNNPGTPTVTIAGIEATSVEVIDDTTIRFQSPAAGPDVVALPQDVVVTTANGAVTLDEAYTYVRPGLLIGTRERLAELGFGIFFFDIETRRLAKLIDANIVAARFYVEGSGTILLRHNRRDLSRNVWSRLDTQTGTSEILGEMLEAGTDSVVTVRATTKVGGSLVAMTSSSLGIVDPANLTFNPIAGGAFGGSRGCLAAKGLSEVFFLETMESTLTSVDINNGIAVDGPIVTPAIPVPNPTSLRCHGAAVVGPNLFALFIDQSVGGNPGHLFSINPATGVATEIATLPGGVSELELTPPGNFQ